MLNNLSRFASANQETRREVLVELLEEIGCPFEVLKQPYGKYEPQNIRVTLREGTPRLIVGAHYDSVPESTGANDNGAAVCILVEAIRRFQAKSPPIPTEIVFFDLEELGMLGSAAYLGQVQLDSILGMINLDVCGIGDTLFIAPQESAEKPPFQAAIGKTPQESVCIVDLIPPSDDTVFRYHGIPTISACIAPAEEQEALVELAHAMYGERAPLMVPAVIDTMHNGARDSIAFIQERAMQSVLGWLLSVVREFEPI